MSHRPARSRCRRTSEVHWSRNFTRIVNQFVGGSYLITHTYTRIDGFLRVDNDFSVAEQLMIDDEMMMMMLMLCKRVM